jgi:hypothetical protein
MYAKGTKEHNTFPFEIAIAFEYAIALREWVSQIFTVYEAIFG